MSKSTVARLRELLTTASRQPWGCDGPDMYGYKIFAADEHVLNHTLTDRVEDADLILAAVNNLAALLDVVQQFAAAEPMSGDTLRCIYCGADVPMTYSPHAVTCPWLTARRLCGMEEAE